MKLAKRLLVALSAVAVTGLCQCTTTEVGSPFGDGRAAEATDSNDRYEAGIDREYLNPDPSVYP